MGRRPYMPDRRVSGMEGASAAVAWTPASIAGLMQWVDATDPCYTDTTETTPATNGVGVGRFKDKSGNARHFDQATAGLKPLLQTAGINGLRAILGDGVDDKLLSPAYTVPTVCTIAMVAKAVVNAASGYYCDGQTGNTRVLVHVGATSMGGFAGTAFESVAIADATTPRVYIFEINGASSVIRQTATETTGVDPGNAAETAGMQLFNGAGPSPANVLIAEWMLWNSAIGTTQRGNAYTYLKAKWGTP